MDEIVKKGIELSRTDSKVENFLQALLWCNENKDRLPAYRDKDGIYFALDENVQVFPKIFALSQHHNDVDEDIWVSPVIATENMNYILVRTKGDDFVMDQLTGLTGVLLELNSVYKQIKLHAIELGDNEISWVIAFYGLTCN